MAIYSSFFVKMMRDAIAREGWYDLPTSKQLRRTGNLYFPQDLFTSKQTYRVQDGQVGIVEEGEGAFVGPLGIRLAPGIVDSRTLKDPDGVDRIPLTRPHLLFGIQSVGTTGLTEKVRRLDQSEHVPDAQAVIVLGDLLYQQRGDDYYLHPNRLVRPRVVLVSSDLETITAKASGDWKLTNKREEWVDEYSCGLDVQVGMKLEDAIKHVAYHMDDLLPRTDSVFIRLRRGEKSFAYRRCEKVKGSRIKFPFELGDSISEVTRGGVTYDVIPLEIDGGKNPFLVGLDKGFRLSADGKTMVFGYRKYDPELCRNTLPLTLEVPKSVRRVELRER